ncbi:MAG: EAL domain-containing protein [Granulosicoccus sp.]
MLWLSVSFWADANSQRRDAEQQLLTSRAEGDLFSAMRDLGALRDYLYTEFSFEESDDSLSGEAIQTLVTTNIESLELAIARLQNTQKMASVIDRTLGSRRTVTLRLTETIEAINQWKDTALYAAADEHNLFASRMSEKTALWIEKITRILEKSTALLQASRYIPYRTYLNTTALQDLRFYTWQLSDLVTQERMLVSDLDPLAYGARTPVSYPLQSLRSRIASMWHNLSIYTDAGGVQANVRMAIESLDTDYFNMSGKDMLANSLSVYRRGKSIDSAQYWRMRSAELILQLKNLDQVIASQLNTEAELLKNHATRRLLVDSVLVMFCLALIVAAVWTYKHLIESTRSELKQAEAFSRLSHLIYNSSDIDTIVARMCLGLMEGFGAEEAAVYKYNNLQPLQRTAGWFCDNDEIQAIDCESFRLHPLEISHPDQVEVTATRPRQNGWLYKLFGAQKNNVGSAVYIPLKHEDRLHSLVVIRRPANRTDFSASDIHAVNSLLDQLSTSTQRQRLTRDIKHQANHDALTGLPNRAAFERRLQSTITERNTSQSACAVLFIDLDGFKNINDTHGHSVGDRVLRDVGSRFQFATGANDCVARIGGDEFAVLLHSKGNHETASDVAQELIDSLGSPFEVDAIRLGASIGVSMFPEHGENASDLLKYADMAMYHAKARRSNSIQVYSTELARVYQDKVSMGNDLALAVSLDQLELYYQPQVDATSCKVTGVEALVRWNHPQRGQVSPFEFISLAEKLGLITEIGTWVIHEACRQAALWRQSGLADLRMAVNISSQQFNSNQFVDLLLTALDESGVSPDLFEIELTESLMLNDIRAVISRLNILRGIGIEVAIDDFGTGYSSLQYLDDLPLDVLKIDRSFIIRLSEPDSESSLAQSISAMAKTLGLRTVAEGVETEEQLGKVIEIGCDVIQGYYFSKPVPAAEIPDTISRIDAIEFTRQKAA